MTRTQRVIVAAITGLLLTMAVLFTAVADGNGGLANWQIVAGNGGLANW